MKRLILLACLCMATSVHACKDSFRFAQDKQEHLYGSMFLGVVSRVVAPDPLVALGLAVAPGVLKELYDGQHPEAHCMSAHDLLYDVVGAAIGVYTTHWIIGPGRIQYRTEF